MYFSMFWWWGGGGGGGGQTTTKPTHRQSRSVAILAQVAHCCYSTNCHAAGVRECHLAVAVPLVRLGTSDVNGHHCNLGQPSGARTGCTGSRTAKSSSSVSSEVRVSSTAAAGAKDEMGAASNFGEVCFKTHAGVQERYGCYGSKLRAAAAAEYG